MHFLIRHLSAPTVCQAIWWTRGVKSAVDQACLRAHHPPGNHSGFPGTVTDHEFLLRSFRLGALPSLSTCDNEVYGSLS